MEKLLTGTAYHGNRIIRHVEEDMRDVTKHGMNLVVHMFTHNDWDRHLGVMKDIVRISEDQGLEVWIDNWGLGGAPGDKSHFLEYHPEAHQVYSDGSVDPVTSCYNSPAFLQFTKDWLDAVAEFGGKSIFWDEPRFLTKKDTNGNEVFSCCCENCKKLFREKYGKDMPATLTPEVVNFRAESMYNYFDAATTHAAKLGMQNHACVMLHTLEYAQDLVRLPNMTTFGSDPYWNPGNSKHEKDPYHYVYTNTRKMMEITKQANKGTHIWIQGFDIPAGYEDQILIATDAAYDAGARTIIDWSFRGAESNTYRSEHCDRVWETMGEAMKRIRNRYFDEVREQKRMELLGNI